MGNSVDKLYISSFGAYDCYKTNKKADKNKQIYTDNYTKLKNTDITSIREEYKVIDVEWLDVSNVEYEMFGDKYFDKKKEEIIHSMLTYYLNREDRAIYKKTDYLCNEREKLCICNTHADDFRKIYDGINYKEEDKYISWFREKKQKY